MRINTVSLIKNILNVVPEGLSKVKLAKVTYFTFKELVRANLVDIDDIKFIRMPLGPVPDGFSEVLKSSWVKLHLEKLGLSFNK